MHVELAGGRRDGHVQRSLALAALSARWRGGEARALENLQQRLLRDVKNRGAREHAMARAAEIELEPRAEAGHSRPGCEELGGGRLDHAAELGIGEEPHAKRGGLVHHPLDHRSVTGVAVWVGGALHDLLVRGVVDRVRQGEGVLDEGLQQRRLAVARVSVRTAVDHQVLFSAEAAHRVDAPSEPLAPLEDADPARGNVHLRCG